jgi:4-hydroxy 2-oxovalerate aldolase
MNNIKVLDCTLRDGGYVNNWAFGNDNITKIISKLYEANIDIVECGFLTNKVKNEDTSTLFDTINKMERFIPDKCGKTEYVCMINFGEYDIDDIPDYYNGPISGIRVAFHKCDMVEALRLCSNIKQKGYKVFLQPMVTVTYSDTEFLELIERSNEIKPYAFYIVDSFGVMKRNDLMRLYYLVDHNLEDDIFVGYHSHNNIQLSYSNAQSLVDLKTKRKLIIDSSVLGMGRGAGNLNTELFIEYLNDNNEGNYKTKPLLQIIDEVLSNIYITNYWGYSLPYYISAKQNCHPNYATYLNDKNTLTVEDISNILSGIEDNKRNNFSSSYIEELYLNYQTHNIDDKSARNDLSNIFKDKTVIAIAPGSSITTNSEKINNEANRHNSITIAINFIPDGIKADFIFISNIRRYEELNNKNKTNFIITSNITAKSNTKYIINYNDLMNEISAVRDNAGLMLVSLLISLGVKKIELAGYDGYTYDSYSDYAEKDMTLIKNHKIVDSLNEGIKTMLMRYSQEIEIEFITDTRYR